MLRKLLPREKKFFELFEAQAGIPVSTTHTITGSIIGVGSMRRLSAVKWGVAGNIVFAWILTIPGAALIAALFYKLIQCLWHCLIFRACR